MQPSGSVCGGLETVTTAGYGAIVPDQPVGKVIAACPMLHSAPVFAARRLLGLAVDQLLDAPEHRRPRIAEWHFGAPEPIENSSPFVVSDITLAGRDQIESWRIRLCRVDPSFHPIRVMLFRRPRLNLVVAAHLTSVLLEIGRSIRTNEYD